MRIPDGRLQSLLEPAVEALGYELVGLELQRGRKHSLLRVYIDSEAGIGVDDCERVSHQVSGVLDVEDPIEGGYTLEVSSPGLDRPLFTARHFERFAGREVRIRVSELLEGRRRFRGELRGFREGNVVIVEDGVERVIPHDVIRSARLVPDV